MSTTFKLQKRNRYPWLFLSLTVLVVTGVVATVPTPRYYELLVPSVGVVAGFVYFLYAQHLQQTRFFAELFRSFNERYEKLNDKLNVIASRDGNDMRSAEEKQILFDYFNLCAEEYLYFVAGYLDEDVWLAWVKGMAYFANCPPIRRLWEAELSGGSYYGFDLVIVTEADGHLTSASHQLKSAQPVTGRV